MSDEAREIEYSETVPADSYEMTTYPAPRGAWDFTNPQRIAIAILLWLNIVVLVVGYLILSGQLVL